MGRTRESLGEPGGPFAGLRETDAALRPFVGVIVDLRYELGEKW